MEMEHANDSSHSSISEDEELNIPTLVLPYQFEPPTTQLIARSAAIQMMKIPQKMDREYLTLTFGKL